VTRRATADTRQEILDVAAELFSAHGFRGTSLADIAVDVDCSKAAVLYHFANKQALLGELLAPVTADLRELLERVSTLPAAQVRRAVVEGFVDLAVRHRSRLQVVRDAGPAADQDVPALIEDQRLGALYEGSKCLLRLVAGDERPASRVAAELVVAGIRAAVRISDLAPDLLRRSLVASALGALGLPRD
jgi:AcrR family transcriptional regulator